MERYSFRYQKIHSKFGYCDVFNMIDVKEMFNADLVADFFTSIVDLQVRTSRPAGAKFTIVDWNATKPFKTLHKKLGIDATLYRGIVHVDRIHSVKKLQRIIFHSPFEMPSENSQQFFLSEGDSVMFSITPQLKTIDESLLQLKPLEYDNFCK